MKKRVSRSEVVLDVDDIEILRLLGRDGHLDAIKKLLHISHKSLLVHLNRLASREFIEIYREKANYKVKVVMITPKGKHLIDVLDESAGAIYIGKTLELIPKKNNL